MTIAELIEMLKELDQNALVIMSKDGEGNGYSPMVDEFSTGTYEPETTWSGDFYSDAEDGEEQDEAGQRCIVLWPTN